MDTALRTTGQLLPDGDEAEDTIIDDIARQGRSMTDALELGDVYAYSTGFAWTFPRRG